MLREIAFDTETTGLDPAQGHRIVELGCVEMIDKLPTGRHFQRYLNPERDVPHEAKAVHGLDEAFLADKPIFAQVVEDFLAFIGEAPLVIHNAAFDMKFLNAELERLGFSPVPMSRAVDTVTMARRKFPGAPANLDALCRRFNVDLSARTLHGALLDASLLCEVYLELSGGRQAAIAFGGEVTEAGVQAGERIVIPARSFPASDAEREAHKAFVSAALKNPLWAKVWEEA